jgi:hypothetical protein
MDLSEWIEKNAEDWKSKPLQDALAAINDCLQVASLQEKAANCFSNAGKAQEAEEAFYSAGAIFLAVSCAIRTISPTFEEKSVIRIKKNKLVFP